MKIKKLILVGVIISILLIIGNYKLADPDIPTQNDQLIGAMILDDKLTFNSHPQKNESNITDASTLDEAIQKSMKNQSMERIYANTVTNEYTMENGQKKQFVEQVFDQEGVYAYFYNKYNLKGNQPSYSNYQENVSNIQIDTIHNDDGNTVRINGDIYFPLNSRGELVYTIAEIYQTQDGKIYAMRGNSFASEKHIGPLWKHSFSDEQTTDIGGKETKNRTEINFSTSIINPKQKIIVDQLDEKHRLLDRQEYEPHNIPEKIIPERKTDYILVQQIEKNEPKKSTYQAYDRSKEYIVVFDCQSKAVCIEKNICLQWDSSPQS